MSVRTGSRETGGRSARGPARLVALMLAGASLALTPGPVAAQFVRGGADSVRVRLAGVERLAPGHEADGPAYEVRISLVHARGFHSWPDRPVVPPELSGLNAIATSVEPESLPPGVEVEAVSWPDPVPVTVRYADEPLRLLSFVGTTTARIRLGAVAGGGEGGGEAVFRVTFQSCDERNCYPPRTERVMARLPGSD